MPGGKQIIDHVVSRRKDPLVQQYLRDKLEERKRQLETSDFTYKLLKTGYEEWAQHQMPYHDVSTLDIVQEPRPLKADRAFRTNFAPAVVRDQKEYIRLTLRKWELTATRYLLCASGNTNATRLARARFGFLGYANALNFYYDQARRRFNTVKSFNLKPVATALPAGNPEPNAPVTYTYEVEEDVNGMGALVEFDGALPRAKLFADWRQGVADPEALKILASPGFNPQRQVILAEKGLLEPDMPARTSQLGPVEYVANRAKYIELKTPPTEINTVLLLNDRHNPDWQVTVDGKPARLLRANFLMRGVHLEPSKEGHTVIFRYLPSTRPLMVSSAAGLIGLIFGVIGLCRRKED